MASVSPSSGSSKDAIRKFLETQDLSILEKPILFEKSSSYQSYDCFTSALVALGTGCLTSFLCPIGTLCPFVMYKHFNLRLDKDSVELDSAANDCCFHVALTKRTVPLEKIQDVELSESCTQTCFGLKQVSIQNAGSGGEAAELTAVFLEAPEEVREVIKLAAKLHRQGASTAPHQQNMQRGGSPMIQRLKALEALVARGVLSKTDSERIRVAVLSAEQDATQRLMEAADLLNMNLITSADFEQLKSKLMAQILAA